MFRGIYRGKRLHAGNNPKRLHACSICLDIIPTNQLLSILLDDFVQVMQRARRAGVNRMIVTAGNLRDCRRALDLVRNDGSFSLCC